MYESVFVKVYRLSMNEYCLNDKGNLIRVKARNGIMPKIVPYVNGYYGVFDATNIFGEIKLQGQGNYGYLKLHPSEMLTAEEIAEAEVQEKERAIAEEKARKEAEEAAKLAEEKRLAALAEVTKFTVVDVIRNDRSLEDPYRLDTMAIGDPIYLKDIQNTGDLTFFAKSYGEKKIGYLSKEASRKLADILLNRIPIDGRLTGKKRIEGKYIHTYEVELTFTFEIPKGMELKTRTRSTCSTSSSSIGLSSSSSNYLYEDTDGDPSQYDPDADEYRNSGAYLGSSYSDYDDYDDDY